VIREKVAQPFQQLDIFLGHGTPSLLEPIDWSRADGRQNGHERVEVVEFVQLFSDANKVRYDFRPLPDVPFVENLLDRPEADVIKVPGHGHNIRRHLKLV